MSECSICMISITVVLVTLIVCISVIWVATLKNKTQKYMHDRRMQDVARTERKLHCARYLKADSCKCSFSINIDGGKRK